MSERAHTVLTACVERSQQDACAPTNRRMRLAGTPTMAEQTSQSAAPFRAVLRRLRHLPDRLLHHARRRRALERIQNAGSTSVLVICHGNICRSPYAAAALRSVMGGDASVSLDVDSAGFIGPGRRPPSHARAVAKGRGIDLDAHLSKVVTAAIVGASDLIIVMDRQQRRAIEQRFEPAHGSVLLLGDLDPAPIGRRAVLDPINQSEEVFVSVYTRIDRCVNSLAGALGTEPDTTGEADA